MSLQNSLDRGPVAGAMDGLIHRLNQFVYPCNNDDPLGARAKAGYPISSPIQIDQGAISGDRVGAAQKYIHASMTPFQCDTTLSIVSRLPMVVNRISLFADLGDDLQIFSQRRRTADAHGFPGLNLAQNELPGLC